MNEALDNLNESFRAEADKVCGSDVNCLFDIAATGDLLIGQSTLDESTTINNELGQIGMFSVDRKFLSSFNLPAIQTIEQT